MKILIISPYIPHPLSGHGTGVYLYDLLTHLCKRHQITILSFYDETEKKFIDDLYKLPINVYLIKRLKGKQNNFYKNTILIFERIFQLLIGTLLNEPFIVSKYRNMKMKRFIKHLIENEKFDIVQIEFLQLAQYVNYITNSKTILHEHDVVYRPIYRKYKLSKNVFKKSISLLELCRVYNYEKKVIKKFDSVFTVTMQDKLLLEKFSETKNIHYLPRGIDVPDTINDYNLRQKQSLLFIGSFAHQPNIEAALWLINEIFPLVLKNYSEAVLYIIGSNPPSPIKKTSADSKNIKILGFVENIDYYLNNCSIFVSPIKSGGGIKIKSLYAMAHGIPVITTRIGMEGIEGINNNNIVIANSTQDFVNKISFLFSNINHAACIGKNGWELMKNQYSWEKVIAQIERLYSILLNNN